MLRTDLDALPVEEKTGLLYASKATAKNEAGETVPVMHACGHDVHMTAWIGAATTLVNDRKRWSGTLMMVGQPADEIGGGASAMLAEGLFTRFPKSDFVFAIHDSDSLPAGPVGIKAGPLLASADSVDIVVYGKGGHGARPNKTIDPIVIAAQIVLGLQSLVSRENDPFDPAVVTVGSIHGGTKHNIIPDEVRMQLTVRAFRTEVRERLLRGIERIAKAECEAGNTPKPPDVKVVNATPVTVNDAALAARVGSALRTSLGDARVVEAIPIMGAEDFSRYAEPGVPILMMWVGADHPATLERALRDGTMLPGLHSSLFAPDAQATITTGVEALVAAAREVFGTARR
jgi:hippurate hydrolase